MPFVRVSMWAGRTYVQKAALADRITGVLIDVLNCPRDGVTVVFEDVDKKNWAMGGVLASKR